MSHQRRSSLLYEGKPRRNQNNAKQSTVKFPTQCSPNEQLLKAFIDKNRHSWSRRRCKTLTYVEVLRPAKRLVETWVHTLKEIPSTRDGIATRKRRASTGKPSIPEPCGLLRSPPPPPLPTNHGLVDESPDEFLYDDEGGEYQLKPIPSNALEVSYPTIYSPPFKGDKSDPFVVRSGSAPYSIMATPAPPQYPSQVPRTRKVANHQGAIRPRDPIHEKKNLELPESRWKASGSVSYTHLAMRPNFLEVVPYNNFQRYPGWH